MAYPDYEPGAVRSLPVAGTASAPPTPARYLIYYSVKLSMCATKVMRQRGVA